jgi:hypothetical protein
MLVEHAPFVPASADEHPYQHYPRELLAPTQRAVLKGWQVRHRDYLLGHREIGSRTSDFQQESRP